MGRAGRQLLVLALGVAALAAATAVAWSGGGGAGPSPPAPPAATADPQRGRELFAAKGCAVCHFGPGATEGVGVAPDLRDIADVAATRVPGMDAAAYVRESILRPAAFVAEAPVQGGPYGAMPALAVSEAEADALVAYLLRPAGP